MWLLLFCFPVLAHPVTFKNGIAISSVHRPKMSNVQVNYTFTRKLALAATYLRLDLDTTPVEAPVLHLNALVKRWNHIGSQANLYAVVGGGFNTISLTSGNQNTFGYVGAQADYETTKIYTAISAFSLVFSEQQPFGLRYRFGIAPYVAKYNDLQIWVVGQLDHISDMTEQPRITPMLRFFYRTALWETGVSLNGVYWFQMMAHF